MSLIHKIAIVTGAAEGIGRGIALALAEAGAALAVCDRDAGLLEETRQLIASRDRPCFAMAFDLRDIIALQGFVDAAGTAFGGIDILVNNAAVMPASRLDTLSDDTVDLVLQINLKAPILLTRAVLPWMSKRGGGSIIHMASVTAHLGFPDVAVYGATKGALLSLARGHAIELAPQGIRVNSVSPGTVDSPMLHRFVQEHAADPLAALRAFDSIHPRGKVASIAEVAAVFTFLASDAAANITGTDIRCDGGFCVLGRQPTN